MATPASNLDPQRQREFALEVLSQLRAAGYEAYWAGGCVRDHLLGRQPKDYDVATNALPPQICQVFRGRKTLEIGAAFGVVAIVGSRGSGTVEVTTFRRDAAYSDGRHPDSVSFSTAEEDATRRDFTINGLFYDPQVDRVIDFVGGVDDLAQRMVRAIGDARQRFNEDKLRMLRAVRMATTFGFELDPATLAAIQEMAPDVTVVSAERIAQEMRLIVVLPDRTRAMEFLRTSGLLAAILPELVPLATKILPSGESAWDRSLRVLAELDQPAFPLALAALLHKADDAATSGSVVSQRWRLSNDEANRIVWLVEQQDALADAPRQAWSRLQRVLIAPGATDLAEFTATKARVSGQPTADADYCRQRLQASSEELNPPPLLTGHDLITHGVPRGRLYAELLEQVRDAQLDGIIQNKSEALALVDRLRAPGPTQ